MARLAAEPRRRRIREDDGDARRGELAGGGARHGRRPRRSFPQVHGPRGRHLSHLQRAAAGGRVRLPDRRTGQAQRRHRRFWAQLGLVAALVEAYRLRPARPEDIHLAPVPERAMSFEARDACSAGWRDRVVVIVLLLVVAGAAWAYTLHQATTMDAAEAARWRDMNMSMNGMEPSWRPADAVLVFVMWTAMMTAMMLPAAGPMIAAFATINRRRRARAAPYVPTVAFLAGYVALWAVFSLAATGAQYLLQKLDLLTTMMQSASCAFSAALFLAAGLYQFSSLKERCLAWCRSPDGFILSEWRDGVLGAAVMGLRHGLVCFGCCTALMLLLFAVAVMDLRWVAALTLVVGAEKLLPWPRLWRTTVGIAAFAAAAGFALAAVYAPA